MLLILLGEILMGVLAYRRAKANGELTEPDPVAEEKEPYVQHPLPPNGTRPEKIIHWLGLEKTADYYSDTMHPTRCIVSSASRVQR